MSEYGFPPLAEPPAPASTPAGATSGLASIEDRSLFGYGLLAPLRRDARRDFQAAGGVALVTSALNQILGVRADDGRGTGELPWRPEFGSLLHRLQYANVDEAFAALARSRVLGAVAQWEPRARITDVRVHRQAGGRVLLTVLFNLVQLGTENVLARNQSLEVPIGEPMIWTRGSAPSSGPVET
jgi:phage baseplate assembly protein W